MRFVAHRGIRPREEDIIGVAPIRAAKRADIGPVEIENAVPERPEIHISRTALISP